MKTHKLMLDYYEKGAHKILCGYGESDKVYISPGGLQFSPVDSEVTCKKCLKIIQEQAFQKGINKLKEREDEIRYAFGDGNF